MILSRLKFHSEISIYTAFYGDSISFRKIATEPANVNSSLKKLSKAGVL